MDKIDLHVHTTASDGSDAPEKVIAQAAELGLRAVAITDHDTLAGLAAAMAAGKALGVEVVGGIEVSTDYRDNNIHLLGYFIDPGSPALDPILDWARARRQERNEKMVARLAADGYDISMEALEEEYPGAVLGRPHIAEHLMRRGYCASVKEGFDRFLGVGGRYFLPKGRIPLTEAAAVLSAAGAVSSLAHPFQYGYSLPEIKEMLSFAKDHGVRAVECYYSEHAPGERDWLLSQAERLGMGVSGGSDYHGARRPYVAMGSGMGDLAVPYEVLAELKKLRYY